MTIGRKADDIQHKRTEFFEGKFVTLRQRRLLEVIESYWRKDMEAPRLKEIAAAMGTTRKNVHQMIGRLRRRELIELSDNRTGTIKTTRLKVAFGRSDAGAGMAVFWGK